MQLHSSHPEQKPARPRNIAAQLDKSRLLQAVTACHNNKRICGVNQAGWHSLSLQRHYDLEQAEHSLQRHDTMSPKKAGATPQSTKAIATLQPKSMKAVNQKAVPTAMKVTPQTTPKSMKAVMKKAPMAMKATPQPKSMKAVMKAPKAMKATPQAEIHEGGDEGAEGNEGHAAAEIHEGGG